MKKISKKGIATIVILNFVITVLFSAFITKLAILPIFDTLHNKGMRDILTAILFVGTLVLLAILLNCYSLWVTKRINKKYSRDYQEEFNFQIIDPLVDFLIKSSVIIFIAFGSIFI